MDDKEEKKIEGKEEKKAEKTIEKATTHDSDEGDKPKAATIVEQANTAAKRLEDANAKQEELLKKQEELAAKIALGGTTEAGAQPPKKKELTDIEYAEALERGEVDPLKKDGFT